MLTHKSLKYSHAEGHTYFTYNITRWPFCSLVIFFSLVDMLFLFDHVSLWDTDRNLDLVNNSNVVQPRTDREKPKNFLQILIDAFPNEQNPFGIRRNWWTGQIWNHGSCSKLVQCVTLLTLGKDATLFLFYFIFLLFFV